MRKNTPANFTPPFKAYEAKYQDERKPMVYWLVGVQDRGGDVGQARASARALLQQRDGPGVIEPAPSRLSLPDTQQFPQFASFLLLRF